MVRPKLELTLRKPVTLNALYGISRFGKKYLSDWGRTWKDECILLVRSEGLDQMKGPCSLVVDLYTSKHQDNDGILKVLMDALQASEIIENDYWIFDLRVIKHLCPPDLQHIHIVLKEINVKS